MQKGKEVYRDMEQWLEIRKRVLREGASKRQILRETGMHWTTLEKILQYWSRNEGSLLSEIAVRWSDENGGTGFTVCPHSRVLQTPKPVWYA